jgi:trimethylamine--corrinoid protein Co-methyltransferase
MKEFKPLSPQDIEAIHQATMQVLSETGILLSHPDGVKIMRAAGAREEDGRLLIPQNIVEEAIKSCARRVEITGRNGEPICLGDGSLHWHNLGGARDVYNPTNGERRAAQAQDIVDSTRLLDGLDGVTSITPFFTPQDVPGELMELAMYRHALPNTIKPLHGPGVQKAVEVKYIVRMAEVIGPPTNMLTLSASPVSPLSFPDEIVEAIIEITRRGITFIPLPCPTAGSTAPLSIAGALVQQNAEVLASLVLAQLVKPGLAVVYAGRLAMMEPRTGLSVWGGVELGMASAATVQIGHHYGLPVNVYGFSTNAHVLDVQNGFERAFNALLPALAGADELSGIGEMAAGVMSSYAQMVCDNEIAASVRRVRNGFEVDEDSLAVEVIAKVMRGDRNFLGQAHTRQYLRAGELYLTYLAERGSWEGFAREGSKGMAGRAQAETERILAEHQVPPLSEDQDAELDLILAKAQEELLGKM